MLYLSSMMRRQGDIFLPMRLVISWWHCHVFLQTKWSMLIFLYGWIGFAVLYLVNTILFRSVVLIFVVFSMEKEMKIISWEQDVLYTKE